MRYYDDHLHNPAMITSVASTTVLDDHAVIGRSSAVVVS
jgi:hypothetical protein